MLDSKYHRQALTLCFVHIDGFEKGGCVLRERMHHFLMSSTCMTDDGRIISPL